MLSEEEVPRLTLAVNASLMPTYYLVSLKSIRSHFLCTIRALLLVVLVGAFAVATLPIVVFRHGPFVKIASYTSV